MKTAALGMLLALVAVQPWIAVVIYFSLPSVISMVGGMLIGWSSMQYVINKRGL